MAEMARTASTIKYHSVRETTWRSEGRWEVKGLSVNGETCKYALFREMTDPMDLRGIINYSREAIGNEQPRVATSQEVWAFADRTYEEKDNHLREFLQEGMRRSPNTSSVVIHEPEGEIDKMLHNYGTLIETSIEGDMGCENGLITEVTNTQALEYSLGTQDVERINKVSQWINNTPFYIWRNNKPEQDTACVVARVVGFYAYDDRLGLDCYRNSLVCDPAFRVLRIE